MWDYCCEYCMCNSLQMSLLSSSTGWFWIDAFPVSCAFLPACCILSCVTAELIGVQDLSALGPDLIALKCSISREQWARTVPISWNNEFLMSMRIAARDLKQINLQKMRTVSAFIWPRSQDSYSFSEGRKVSRMSRNILWWPSAFNSGASGLPKQIFFFPVQSQNKMCRLVCRF